RTPPSADCRSPASDRNAFHHRANRATQIPFNRASASNPWGREISCSLPIFAPCGSCRCARKNRSDEATLPSCLSNQGESAMPAILAGTPRPSILSIGVLTLLGLIGALSPCVGADEESPTIEDRSKWSNVFGGKEATWQYQVKTPRAFKGRAAWKLTRAGRTL